MNPVGRPFVGLGLSILLVAAGACRHELAPARAPQARADVRWLPARVRRLTNAEYERSVAALVGPDGTSPASAGRGQHLDVLLRDEVSHALPPDVRQDGYTPNAEQSVPSAWAAGLDAIARSVAHRAVHGGAGQPGGLGRLVECAASAKERDEGCAIRLVETLGQRAWRRPLEAAERAALLGAFTDAAAAFDFDAGAEVLLTALLESPSFVYVTELGAGGAPGTIVTLTPYEIASLLSYTLRGAPPDAALLQAASTGALLAADAREAHARRLLSLSDTRFHFRRFVLEWLEVDGLSLTTKNSDVYPGYEELKEHMLAETAAFADEVMVYGGGSVRALLDARFASVDPDMARLYGLHTWGARASLAETRRAGVLQQASFLAAHAHEDGTSPVKRGDFVLRRLLCTRLPRPAEVGIETAFPPPTPQATTRERFSAHSEDAACSGCHRQLDPLGFAFESFDAVGASRSTDHGRPIDSAVRVEVGGETHSFGDSLELSRWLARDPAVAECYLRQAFRYFTGQSDARVEAELLALPRARSTDDADDLFEGLIAYVRSDLFIHREVRP